MDTVDDPHSNGIIEDTSADQLNSPGSSYVSDIFGDPQILPRVGDEYQAEIPPLRTESDCIQFVKNPTDAEVVVDVSHSSLMGLPIPIMWVLDKADDIKHELLEFLGDPNDAANTIDPVESENGKGSHINSNNKDSRLKVEPSDVALDYGKVLGGSASCALKVVGNETDADLSSPQPEKSNLKQKYIGKGCCPVPGSLGNLWSNIEQESFLLGLYIFGKNLVQVKKFIESREMGDMLSFYYGKFYRSDGHHRWSECRKIRSRRCIQGQRIFTGWRQQELLSRFLPRVSEECQNTLLEVSRTFGEGKISLEEYVSTLKATVGIKILVEAVGIGKGKQDLTGIIMEPAKANRVIPSRLEFPVGKACSSLTSGDIIKFLTGDFRLSKARSNDLFWEAVWPRLLARGWHSEQPKNCSYTGSKHSLVFLIPGVKKFSRRRLIKGNHYFDSVSDVLNRIALDPRLIELEVEAAKGNEGCGWSNETKLDQDDHSDHQRHCYLQPQLPNGNADLMKFTVVDTSLVHGEESFTVRKLRNLPVDTANTPTPKIILRDNDGDNSGEPVDELDSSALPLNGQENTNTSIPSMGMFDRVVSSNLSGCEFNVLEQGMPINGPDPNNAPMDNHKDKYTDTYDKQPGKTIKCHFSRRKEPGQSNYLAPATKRQRLTACSHAETSHSTNSFSVGPGLKEEEHHFQIDTPDVGENMFSEVGLSQEKVYTSSLARGSPDDSTEDILSENCFGTAVSPEKSQPQNSIDLNVPHIPPDFETGEPFITKVADSQDDPSVNGSSFPSKAGPPLEGSQALRSSCGVASSEQQPLMVVRRQSTRNRPLTTRALEAFACGFLSTKRKRRGM